MTLFEWIVLGGVWLIVVVWSLALMLAAGRRTPAPPAGPRGRLVRDRERAGRVEVLPSRGDAQNARNAGRRER